MVHTYHGTVGGEPTVTVIADHGRTFRARLVFRGQAYGLNDCLTHDSDKVMIEFYDVTFAGTDGFGRRGQFITRYHLDSLRIGNGICLNGGVRAWTLDAESLAYFLQWASNRVLQHTLEAVS